MSIDFENEADEWNEVTPVIGPNPAVLAYLKLNAPQPSMAERLAPVVAAFESVERTMTFLVGDDPAVQLLRQTIDELRAVTR